MIQVLLESELEALEGYVGNFKAHIRTKEGPFDTPAGAVVVCTGYKEFDASRIEHYGYGRLPNVITSFELEQMLRQGRVLTREGKPPRCVALIHCVGSRSPEYPSLLLAGLLHDGPEVRPRDQVQPSPVLRLRPLHRHARLRKGVRGLLPAHPPR